MMRVQHHFTGQKPLLGGLLGRPHNAGSAGEGGGMTQRLRKPSRRIDGRRN
jgi:hypothetical protein